MKRRDFLRSTVALVRPSIPWANLINSISDGRSVLRAIHDYEYKLIQLLGLWNGWLDIRTFYQLHQNGSSFLSVFPMLVGEITQILKQSEKQELYDAIFHTDRDTGLQILCHLFGDVTREERQRALLHILPLEISQNSIWPDIATISEAFAEFPSTNQVDPESLGVAPLYFRFGHWLARTSDENFQHFLDALPANPGQDDCEFSHMMEYFLWSHDPLLSQDQVLWAKRILSFFWSVNHHWKSLVIDSLTRDAGYYEMMKLMENTPLLSSTPGVSELVSACDEVVVQNEALIARLWWFDKIYEFAEWEYVHPELLTEYQAGTQAIRMSIWWIIERLFPSEKEQVEAEEITPLVDPSQEPADISLVPPSHERSPVMEVE